MRAPALRPRRDAQGQKSGHKRIWRQAGVSPWRFLAAPARSTSETAGESVGQGTPSASVVPMLVTRAPRVSVCVASFQTHQLREPLSGRDPGAAGQGAGRHRPALGFPGLAAVGRRDDQPGDAGQRWRRLSARPPGPRELLPPLLRQNTEQRPWGGGRGAGGSPKSSTASAGRCPHPHLSADVAAGQAVPPPCPSLSSTCSAPKVQETVARSAFPAPWRSGPPPGPG